jgi:hypothetical protein
VTQRFWRAVDGGVALDLQVQPGAKADAVEGVVQQADGRPALKLRVKAPPAEGKANAAVVRLLARRWGLRKAAVSVAAGGRSRAKRLHLSGDPEDLAARLAREASAG